MTTMLPSEAPERLCPFARTFGMPTAQTGCHGSACALWRWVPVPADHPAFTAAYAKAKAYAPNEAHAARVKRIMEDREAHGIPTKPERGYCGAGGQP